MAKFRPGIPEGFDLNVPEVKPVADLGDYLDEPGVRPVRVLRLPDPTPEPVEPVPVTAQPTVPERPVDPVPPSFVAAEVRPVVEMPIPPRQSPPVVPVPEPVREPAPVADDYSRFPKSKAPRREISMTPETLRMSDELLEMIRSATGQRDAKANELFHAAILLLYEVRGELDLHRVPKRGKWGTPTARAFPVALKSAFLEAIIERARKDQRRVG